MNMFDDILPPKDGTVPAPSGNMFDDVLPPLQGGQGAPSADKATSVAAPSRPLPSWLSSAGRYAADVGHSLEAGADKGIAGLLGAPADALGAVQDLYNWGQSKAQGRPVAEIAAEMERPGLLPVPSRESMRQYGSHAFEQQSQQRYEPETRVGKFAKTAAEFGAQGVAFPGSIALKAAPEGAGLASRLFNATAAPAADLSKNVVKYGAVPGVASEAAGQLTEGQSIEPWARAGAGLGTAAGLALGTAALRPSAGRVVAGAGGELSAADRAAALGRFDTLMANAAENGIQLPQGLAWDAATNGASDMAGLYRHAEAMGKLNAVNAAIPGQVEAAGRAQIDRFGPAAAAPTQLGGEVAEAARGALDVTPQGMAVSQALEAAGPRVTPLQAGEAAQSDLQRVRAAREAQRAEQAARDAALARSVPDSVGMDGPPVTVTRPGEPALQTIDTGTPSGPGYAPPPDGPATLASTAPTRPAPAEPTGPRGPSMARFIAQNGGLGLERGDVAAAGLDRLRQPGVANLVREGAPSIDNHWRERLIEEGYLPPDRDGGMQRNVHDEIISALEEEARGRPTRPYDWHGQDAAENFGRQSSEFSARTSQAGTDLNSALREAGVDPRSVHPDIMDRATAAMVRDGNLHPLDAYEQIAMAMREPVPRGPTMREVPTTVTEEVPTVRWGQVDPRPADAALREMMRTAKGDVRGAIGNAIRDLHGPDGLLDMSVEGLRNARGRLDAAAEAAAAAGDREKFGHLTVARQAVDRQLKQVPEQAAADANFAANSRPLDPFSGNAPLGRVTAREGNLPSGRAVTPAEQVPSHLSGATATREALANGGEATRQALEQRRVTQVLDAATNFRGEVSVERLRAAMRSDEHVDALAQMPGARASLERIAMAQEGRDALKGTLVGKLAERDSTTAQAISTLFPKGEQRLANMEREVGQAVASVAQQNPTAARQLVRQYIEGLFNRAQKDNFGGPNPNAGPKFRQSIVADPQDAANLVSAVRALPEGAAIAHGMERFLDVLYALGRRQNVGSRTAYNEIFKAEMSGGGKAEEAARALATGGLKLPTRIMEAMDRWRLGKNMDELARLIADPDAVGAFRGLVAVGDKGGDIRGPLARLVAIGTRGGRIGGRGYHDAPLQVTVRPGQSQDDRAQAQ